MEEEKKRMPGFKDEAVSKVYFAENQPCPNPKGKADFQQLPPFRAGREVAEKRKTKTSETAPGHLSAFTKQSSLSTNYDSLNQQPNHTTINQSPNQQPNP